MSKFEVTRYHDFSYGHRVANHESSCSNLHGHNGRVHFCCRAVEDNLDSVGRVIDFSVIKSKLCWWLEDNWDHRMLIWCEDPLLKSLRAIDPTVVIVPFNPTAENMAQYLVEVIGPAQLKGTGVYLSLCRVEETRKCSASFAVL
jgi:6-pyruvoyltetrahydropterin/6-carboxytetrahydropterin synthase